MEARIVDGSGSGNADMLATELLKVNTSGSGDVFYKGSPTLTLISVVPVRYLMPTKKDRLARC